MARYAYSAKNRAGGAVQGDVEAPTRRDALRILATRGLTVSQVSEASAGAAPGPAKAARRAKPAAQAESGAAAPRADADSPLFTFASRADTTPRRGERLPFLEALYDLTSSGLSAGEAVRLLSVRVKAPRLRALSEGLWEQLSEGVPLSRAMGNFPAVFDASIVNLIAAGEATGSLNDTLARIIAHLVERREMTRQLLNALAYPAILMLVASGLILFFLFFLLPRLQGLLDALGADMPMSTKILIGASTFLLHYGVFVLLAIVLAAVSFWRWRNVERGRLRTDGWLIELPLVGRFVGTRTVLEFSQTLSVLLENGITASEALQMTERQITNRVHRAAFAEARARVLEGESLSASLARTGAFPDLVLDRLAVGENTGNVAPSLRQIGQAHQKMLSQQLSLFTNVITTGALIGVFIFVGFIALAIVSAVFQVSSSFK